MLRFVLPLLFLLGSPNHALALDCAEIAAMARIVGARNTLVSGSARLSDTLRRLDQDLARVAGSMKDGAPGDLPSSLDRMALRNLADLAHDISLSLRDGDMPAITQRLDGAAKADTLARAGLALARLHCGQNVAADRAIAVGSSTISAIAPRDAMEKKSVQAPATAFYTGLATGIAALLPAALATFLIWRLQARQRRRARRFRVLRDVDMHMQDARHRGTLLDLSCFGAKLRHNGMITDPDVPFAVTLLGVVRPCKITWLNDHYAGLQFSERLRLSQVLGVAAGLAPQFPSATPQMQTAPANGGRA